MSYYYRMPLHRQKPGPWGPVPYNMPHLPCKYCSTPTLGRIDQVPPLGRLWDELLDPELKALWDKGSPVCGEPHAWELIATARRRRRGPVRTENTNCS